MRLLRRFILHPSAFILSELRDLISQIVEVDHGHVTLNLDSETWRNVAAQTALFITTYWPFLIIAFALGVLIGLAIAK